MVVNNVYYLVLDYCAKLWAPRVSLVALTGGGRLGGEILKSGSATSFPRVHVRGLRFVAGHSARNNHPFAYIHGRIPVMIDWCLRIQHAPYDRTQLPLVADVAIVRRLHQFAGEEFPWSMRYAGYLTVDRAAPHVPIPAPLT